jgi:hypothetical protein
LSECLIYLNIRETFWGLVPSRKHVYRTSGISEEITIPYFHPIYLIVLEEANTNPNFLVPAADSRSVALTCFQEATRLAETHLWGSHPLCLSVKVESSVCLEG